MEKESRLSQEIGKPAVPKSQSKLLKNSWQSIASLAVILVLKFLIALIVVRALGASGQGQYYLVISFNGILLQIGSFGIHTASNVFVSRTHHKVNEIHIACILFSGLFGLAIAVLYFFLQPIFHATLLKGVPLLYGWLAVLVLPFTLYGFFWRGLVIGAEKISLLNKLELTSFVFQIALLLILINAGLGITGALIAWIGNILYLSLFGLIALLKLEGKPDSFDLSLIKRLIQFGISSQWGEVARMLVLRSDVFLLNFFWGQEVVGYYSVALSLTEKLWISYTGVYRATTRKLQSLSRVQSLLLLTKINRLMGSTAFLMIIFLEVFSRWFIPFLYGAEFVLSVTPFNILLLSLIPYGIWAGVRIYITGQLMMPKLTSVIHWVSLLFSIIAYYFLIVEYQAVGAALGSVMSYLILCAIGIGVLRKHMAFSISSFFLMSPREVMQYRSAGMKELSRISKRIYSSGSELFR